MIIDIFSEDDNYLVVKNNIQPKNVQESSTSVGLKNIIKRYEFISDKKVVVEKTEEAFLVKVPLIHIDME